MQIPQRRPQFPANVPCDLAVKILNRIPPEHRQSFTPQQIKALHHALLEKAQKPAVRVSLGSFYIALGRYPGAPKSMLVPTLCLMVSMLGIGCIAGLIKFRYSYQAAHAAAAFQFEEDRMHPTVLPFRKSQTNCEGSGADWVKGECVDHTHDPTF
ncbi:MAG: hypothetical protein AAF579_22910 [Cyanobacteria bacterium P01_C01_bin.118]